MNTKHIQYFFIVFAALTLHGFVQAEQPETVGVSGNLTIFNSLLDNDANFDQYASSLELSYSAVRGDTVPAGTGNKALNDNYDSNFDSHAQPLNERSYYVANNSLLVNGGGTPAASSSIPEKDINGNPRIYDGTIDIGAGEYTMIYGNGNGLWNDTTKWNIGRIPDENDVVTILNELTVTNTDAICKSIIAIADTGKITINPAAQLDVKTTIQNTNTDKLIIKASSETSSGTLIFQNPPEAPLYGTVEMYSVANRQITPEDTVYRWQYIGIPVKSISASPVFDGSWIRKWNEASIEYSKWEQLSNTDLLHSFNGYEVTQDTERTFTFKGILENNDTTIVLNKSSVPFYAGQHVLSNPYTAAINISDLTFGANTEATVYVYNTGSYEDWNIDNENGRIGDNPGQYTAVPQNVSQVVYPSIPSMQGFIIRATADAGSITIPYASHTQNITQQRAKNINQPCFLRVDVKSQHASDRVWLLHEPSASKGFDNGWDGYKLIGSEKTVLIYAKEDIGNLQVNTIDEFNDINLHFRAGSEQDYELTILNQNILEEYSEIYLIDLENNQVVPIESDTVRYAFTASNTKTATNRFKIMTGKNMNFNPSVENLISIFNNGNELMIYNASREVGTFALYNLAGHMVHQRKLMPGLNTFSEHMNTQMLIIRAQVGEETKTSKILLSD